MSRGGTHGSPTDPLLLVRGEEHAVPSLPAGKAGLRLGRCPCSGRLRVWSQTL
jgi:hypothetical protein